MLSVLPLLVRLHVKSQMEYRGAFLLNRVVQIITYASVYIAIWVLLNRFDSLGGWDWGDMALLLAFQLLAYSLGASLSFVQFRNIEGLVQNGMFDVLLVKPISPWAYLTFSGLNIDYAGHIALAVGLMIWALTQTGMTVTGGNLIYLLAALLSAAAVTAALMTMIGAAALVLVRSSYLFAIFFGFWELTRYPISIYPAALQWMMLTIVPLGFLAYVPVAVFLGKDVVILGGWAPLASLVAGPIAVGIAMLHWRWSIRHYQGGGG